MIKKGSSNYPFSIDSKMQNTNLPIPRKPVDCIYEILEENL